MCLWQIHKVNRDRRTQGRKEKQELLEPANKHERFHELKIHSRQKMVCTAKWYFSWKQRFYSFQLKDIVFLYGSTGENKTKQNKPNQTKIKHPPSSPLQGSDCFKKLLCFFKWTTEKEKKPNQLQTPPPSTKTKTTKKHLPIFCLIHHTCKELYSACIW